MRRALAAAFGPQQAQLEVKVLEQRGSAARLAAQARKKRYRAVIAVGGDGTLHEIAAQLVGSPCALGLIPTGSGNGLARALGIPLNAEMAAQICALAKIKRIDALQGGQEWIFNVGGFGCDAWIARSAQRYRWVTRISGTLRYLLAAVDCLWRFKPAELRVKAGGRKLQGRFSLLCLANSPQYGMGFVIAPKARTDDGKMNIVALPAMPSLTLFYEGWRVLRGQPIRYATTFTTRSLEVNWTSAEVPPFHSDGEFIATVPQRWVLRKQALRVLVP